MIAAATSFFRANISLSFGAKSEKSAACRAPCHAAKASDSAKPTVPCRSVSSAQLGRAAAAQRAAAERSLFDKLLYLAPEATAAQLHGFLSALSTNAGMWAVVVIMPAVEAEFALTRADTSLPYMLSMLGYGLGNFIIGRWVDRVGIATALTGASFGIAASFFAATQAGNIGVLAAIHFILGLFAAVGFAPLMSDISHWFIKWRGTAMALVASANYLSGAVWPTVLAGVLAGAGW